MTQPQNIQPEQNNTASSEPISYQQAQQNITDQMSDMQKLNLANQEYEANEKKFGVAFALWWFTGAVGGHRFYLGDTGYALGMLFTLGGLGVWALVDVFMLSGRVQELNKKARREANSKYGLITI